MTSLHFNNRVKIDEQPYTHPEDDIVGKVFHVYGFDYEWILLQSVYNWPEACLVGQKWYNHLAV